MAKKRHRARGEISSSSAEETNSENDIKDNTDLDKVDDKYSL